MLLFDTKEGYVRGFEEELSRLGSQSKNIQEYIRSQFHQLDRIMEEMNTGNFWTLYPKILGIDAKLVLVIELLSFKDFPDEEIIRIVETDYPSYFKELCGDDLSMQTKHSLVFNVL